MIGWRENPESQRLNLSRAHCPVPPVGDQCRQDDKDTEFSRSPDNRRPKSRTYKHQGEKQNQGEACCWHGVRETSPSQRLPGPRVLPVHPNWSALVIHTELPGVRPSPRQSPPCVPTGVTDCSRRRVINPVGGEHLFVTEDALKRLHRTRLRPTV